MYLVILPFLMFFWVHYQPTSSFNVLKWDIILMWWVHLNSTSSFIWAHMSQNDQLFFRERLSRYTTMSSFLLKIKWVYLTINFHLVICIEGWTIFSCLSYWKLKTYSRWIWGTNSFKHATHIVLPSDLLLIFGRLDFSFIRIWKILSMLFYFLWFVIGEINTCYVKMRVSL